MRWPWVSRARLERADSLYRAAVKFYETELKGKHAESEEWRAEYMKARTQIDETRAKAAAAAEKQRARRRARRGEVRDAKERRVPVGAPVAESQIDRAIRQTAGADAALARHLYAFAREQRALEVDERDIVAQIRRGVEL